MDDANSQYEPLATAPTATTFTVRELLKRVVSGRVRVPKFQRALRWRTRDVRMLFDSIWRGYPIGSLLLWKREAQADRIKIGGARLDVPAVTDAWWVVDGQQRTTSLSAALLDLEHAGDRRWTLYFDPHTASFMSGEPPNPDAAPVSVLGDLTRFSRWLRPRDLEPELVEVLEDAQQRLLDYEIPAYVVEADDPSALRAIFIRTNSTGQRMRPDEIFRALLPNVQPDAASRVNLDALQTACNSNGFGTPSSTDTLKALLAMSNMDPLERLETLDPQTPLQFIEPDDAEQALSRSTDFLRKRCGVPHLRLLPYGTAFVILAKWFALHPSSSKATLDWLVRWFWRYCSTDGRAEAGVLRQHTKAIDDDEQASLDRLLRLAPSQSPERWQLRVFRHNVAVSRVEMLALTALNPTTPLTAVSIAGLVSSDQIARTIVEAEHEAARTIANRALLDTHGKRVARALISWTDDEALASHLITPPMRQALEHERTEEFLKLRTEAIERYLLDFLRCRCGWDEPMVRPTKAYTRKTG